MKLSYDPDKRALTLRLRGLDFEDAVQAFNDRHFDQIDDRYDYGEIRWITTGVVNSEVVKIVWTDRIDSRRIISMWKAKPHERENYYRKLD